MSGRSNEAMGRGRIDVSKHARFVSARIQSTSERDQVIRGEAMPITGRIQSTSERDQVIRGEAMPITESRIVMRDDTKTSIGSDEDVTGSVKAITSSDQSA